MCGIAGLINRQNAPVDELIISNMCRMVQHRGPDAEGIFLDRQVGLGHRLLAIQSDREDAAQPRRLGEDLVLVHNGEIYNFRAVRQELEALGHHFHGDTDTEVILTAYRQWGYACVGKFRGMWAFALYDAARNVVWLSRDRFGEKPLYYWVGSLYFAFGSEIKQFFGLKDWEPAVHQLQMREFLLNGRCDHRPETLLKGVFQLPAGCHLEYDLHRHQFSVIPYFDLREETSRELQTDPEEAAATLLQHLKAAVEQRITHRVQMGMTLSGGLDSSAIAALWREAEPHAGLDAYSAVFPGFSFDESAFIDAMAQAKKLTSFTRTPDFEDFTKDLDRLVWHQDLPFSSPGIYAQYAVYEQAGQAGKRVLLDGQGADELLAGYDGFLRFSVLSGLSQSGWDVTRWGDTLLSLLQARRAVMKYLAGRFSSVQREWAQLPFFQADAMIGNKPEPASLREYSLDMIQGNGLPHLLRLEDRNAMASGIENRLPFLDHELAVFCLRLPDNLKIRNGVRKYLLRAAMRDKLPAVILERRDKTGFETPDALWLQSNTEWVQNELRNFPVESIRPFVLSMHAQYCRRPQEAIEQLLWRCIIFGRWTSVFQVKI